MSITFGKASGGAQSSSGDGIFFDVALVVSVKAYHKASPDRFSRPDDVGVEVSYRPEGKDLNFTPTFYVGGNLKREQPRPGEGTGQAIGWGSAFKVQVLFESAGLEFRLNDDESIPEDLLEDLIGKKVLVLNYRDQRTKPDDKLKTTPYAIIGKPGDEDYLRSRFLNDVENGYVKNYQGEVDPVSQTFGGSPPPF